MNGNSLLVDTNILLYLLEGDEALIPLLEENQIYISFITQLEMLGFKGLTETEYKKISEFLSECVIVDINNRIKDITIDLRRKHGLKLPDSIIIATSVYLDMPLISADKEFKKVKNINLILYSR
jgi:predicted nucleic acid-binding protein